MPAGATSGLVRRADINAAPAGSGWHAVSVRGSQKEAGLWPSFAIDFLGECGEFLPLARHLEKYARYHGIEPAQMRELGEWSARMAAAGLLVRSADLLARYVNPAGDSDSAVRIEAIGLPSGGNPERLRRAIGTFARNAAEHGREITFTVAANCAPEQKDIAAAALSGMEGVRVRLICEEKKRQYALNLAAIAEVDPDVALFGVCDPLGAGFACGANRNTLMLINAGRPFLSLDDDMACETAFAPGREKETEGGLLVFSSRDGFERWFYREYEEAFADPNQCEVDYLGLHERLLGRSIGGIFRAGDDVNLLSVSDEMLRRMQETDGRVVATFTGHYGHPGVPTSYYCLTYRDATLARLTGDGENAYRAYMASAGVFAAVPRPAIADASLSPGMAIGIDGRELIPPFPPVMHAEDFVWGAAVWQCCANGFAGHLPVALRHDPGKGRGIIVPPLGPEIPPVAVWEFAHILRGMLLCWSPPPGEEVTADRMELLGRHLCEIAGAGAKDFHEYVRGFVLHHESDKIAYAEYCLTEEEEAPDFWKRDVEQYIEQTRRALAAADFDIPFDMREKWTPEEARKLIQRMIYEYGRLLRAWPALMSAAKSQNERRLP